MALPNVPKLGMSVSFAMTSAIPAEYNSYFSSLEEAQAAAATAGPPGSTDTLYFYSQIIHVLTDSSADAYIIQPDKTLKHLGAESGALIEQAQLKGVRVGGFTFTQATAEKKWEIAHNMGKYPSVTVADSAGSEVVGEVQYVDSNNVILLFASPFSGVAYLN